MMGTILVVVPFNPVKNDVSDSGLNAGGESILTPPEKLM